MMNDGIDSLAVKKYSCNLEVGSNKMNFHGRLNLKKQEIDFIFFYLMFNKVLNKNCVFFACIYIVYKYKSKASTCRAMM